MMRRTERLLLYVTALVLVGLLFFDGEWSLGGNPPIQQSAQAEQHFSARTQACKLLS